MAYTKFITTFVDVYSKHFVCKKRKHKNFRKPWLTKYLFKKIKKRDQLYGKLVKYRDAADLKAFKEYGNKVTKELRKAKDAYYFEMFFFSCSRSDKLWNKLNFVLGRQRRSEPIERIAHKGQQLSRQEMVEQFNKHFLYRDTYVTSAKLPDLTFPPNQNTPFFQPTDVHEMHTVLSSLKIRQALVLMGYK